MSQDLFLVEVVAYTGAGTETLRYATRGFVTGPAETPANTYFDGRVVQPLQMQRWLFAQNSTQGRSTIGFGDIVLDNSDGELNALIKYGFDGRTVTVRRGAVGAAYPGGFTTLFVGTMGPPEIEQTTFTLKLRDKQLDANVPLQTTKYTGAGLGTLEGTADDLKGKPKPVCYGKVFNVAPPCVETAKLIYQVNDGAVASVDAVYDRGVALLPSRINRYIAVGGSGSDDLQESLDGQTSWTAAADIFSTNDTPRAICYGDGLWIAGGDSGKLAWSADLVTWTEVTSTFGSSAIHGIAFGNGVFVAVGADGKSAISSDGKTWTALIPFVTGPYNGGGSPWTDIVFAPFGTGLFVTVCYDGANGRISVSGTGTSWVEKANLAGKQFVGVGFGGSLFVAVGGDSGGAMIYTSPDAHTWTQRTEPASHNTGQYYSVTHGGGVYVAVGGVFGVGVHIASSTDGISWTARTSANSGDIHHVIFAGSQFVAGGRDGELQTSPTGTTWTARTSAYANDIFRIAYGQGGATVDSYANSTDLLDNALAPEPGHFKAYLAGGYFRLGDTPDGQVTADVTEGAAASDRTTAKVYERILDVRMGKTSGDWNAGDITTLDAAKDDVIGYWTDLETTFGAVFDKVANSVGASWYIDAAGVFRIKQLLAPSGTPVLVITANDLRKPLRRKLASDPGQGLPSYQTIVRYAKNHTVQVSDVAASVTDARRAFLADEWRDAKDTDATVQTKHLLAVQNIEESLLTVEADAVAEAERRQTLRGVQRHLYEAVIQFNDESDALDLTDVVEINHGRYLLNANSLFRVLGIDLDAKERALTLTCWGKGSGE